jgi:hypothetical protein
MHCDSDFRSGRIADLSGTPATGDLAVDKSIDDGSKEDPDVLEGLAGLAVIVTQ